MSEKLRGSADYVQIHAQNDKTSEKTQCESFRENE